MSIMFVYVRTECETVAYIRFVFTRVIFGYFRPEIENEAQVVVIKDAIFAIYVKRENSSLNLRQFATNITL